MALEVVLECDRDAQNFSEIRPQCGRTARRCRCRRLSRNLAQRAPQRALRAARRPATPAAPHRRPHWFPSKSGPGFVLEKLVLDINGFEPVPAYFVKPKQVGREGSGDPVQPLARRRIQTRQGRASPAQARRRALVRGGPDRAGLLRPLPRHVVLRRAVGAHRIGHLQGNALEGPGACGA